MSLSVIAEGVETTAHAGFLHSPFIAIRCSGYLYSKPKTIPVAEMAKLLNLGETK